MNLIKLIGNVFVVLLKSFKIQAPLLFLDFYIIKFRYYYIKYMHTFN
jgi:hypothetical protein